RRGLRMRDVLAGPGVAECEARVRRVVDSGIPARAFTVRARPLAGPEHERVFSVSAAPLSGRSGKTLGVCVTVEDVSVRVSSEERLALIGEASRCIGSTLDVRRTAQELADVAVPRLADFVSVDVLEPLLRGDEPGPATKGARLRRMAIRSAREGAPEAVVPAGEIDIYPGQSPPVRCMAEGRPLLLQAGDSYMAHFHRDDPVRAAKAERYAMHSWLFIPVRARGVTLGVAVFIRCRPTRPYEAEDLLLAEELVARAAVCLDNARRFTRERETARALRRSLLPRALPPQPAVDAAFRCLPASSQTGVGGDWFDVVPLSGARVALVVGDVVGHGIHAAVTMGRLRTAVRTLADMDLPPDELLVHLDDLVPHLDTAQDACATCVYAVYDPITRSCSMACAGHPPPVVRTPDGTTHLPALTPGPPLGTSSRLPFETCELELPDGSEIVLYTDGLIGSRGHDTDKDTDHLRHLLTRPAASPSARCDAILDALLPHHPDDDITLLVARTHALRADQVAVLDVPADPAAVAPARSWTAQQLAAWTLAPMSFVTELVASELVTNAIRYGTPPIQLRLIKNTSLICEVSDASSTAPHLRRARTLDEGGRGLLLVAQLTERWGTRHSREGKTIWCEQPIPDEHRSGTTSDGRQSVQESADREGDWPHVRQK
ncbi:SpoIIE family protein phosphatase, partial [Streptomyces antibioticus]|uniref:SpoIIE family protein phosphatase n=1 Tax=Streptomyces antibioticus TaxID=1890 RepID=UPI0033D1521F